MKRLIALLLLLAPLGLHAAAEPDAVFKSVDVAYTLNGDNSWVMEYRQVVRLQSYMAFNRALGESFIVYNPEYQTLEVLKSTTTMADGTRVDSPANAFNPVLPAAAHGFPAFAHLLEMVVTHVGLERGAEIEFAYRLTTKAGFLPGFGAREILGRPFPVEKLRISFSGPGAAGLRFRALPEAIQPQAGENRLSFELSNLPALPAEPFNQEVQPPQLLVSAIPNWIPALPFDLSNAELPAELKQKAAATVRDFSDLEARADALHRLVAGDIANCPLTWEQTGWRWRSPAEVWKGNYGTALEKTVLLALLFREAGIPAEPLAVALGPAFAADVPGLQQIGAFLVSAEIGNTPRFFSPDNPQAEAFPAPYPGRTAWCLSARRPLHLPPVTAEGNGIGISGRLALAGVSAKGKLDVSLSGIFHRPRAAAENLKDFLTSALKRIFTNPEIASMRVLEMTSEGLHAEVEMQCAWPQEAADGVRLLPRLAPPVVTEETVSAPARLSSLSLEGPFHVDLDLEIEPEAGWRADIAAAPKLEISNPLGRLGRTLQAGEKGTVRAGFHLEIDASPVGPEQYPLLQALARPLLAPDYWLILSKE